MVTEQLTEDDLLDFLRQNGCEEVSRRQLERWHKKDVIPRPIVEYLEFGQGTRSTYPVQAGAQALAVCRLLKTIRNFDAIRFRLWQEGFPIPLPLLKHTIRQLIPFLRWEVPRGEEQQSDAADEQLGILLQKMAGRRSRLLSKKLTSDVLESFLNLQLYLIYGVPIAFGPSYHTDEPSASEVYTQVLNLREWRFLPNDLTSDLQNFSDQGLLSITKMNAMLDEATEEALRQAFIRAEFVDLVFEAFGVMGILPKILIPLQKNISDPFFRAMFLVLALQLEKNGYAENMDTLLETLRFQVPRFRAFQAFYLALEQELPIVAKNISTPQKLWQRIRDLPQLEREEYVASQIDQVREIYRQHQADLDVFWRRHPEIKDVFEFEDSSPPQAERETGISEG